MPELCLSYAGTARLPQGPRRPSPGQRSAHPLPSWPFTSCPPSSCLSALSSYSPRADLSLSFHSSASPSCSVSGSPRAPCLCHFFPPPLNRLSLFHPVEVQVVGSFVRSCKRTGQQDLASRTDARLGHRRRARFHFDRYPRDASVGRDEIGETGTRTCRETFAYYYGSLSTSTTTTKSTTTTLRPDFVHLLSAIVRVRLMGSPFLGS